MDDLVSLQTRLSVITAAAAAAESTSAANAAAVLALSYAHAQEALALALAHSHEQAVLVYQAAASSNSATALINASVFCKLLDDSYTEASKTAADMADAAFSLAVAASDASINSPSPGGIAIAVNAAHDAAIKAAFVVDVSQHIEKSKTTIANRIVEKFPGAGDICEVAQNANIPASNSELIIWAVCFTTIETGLISNIVSRGAAGAVGPECPLCYENLDCTTESSLHSIVIMGCQLPLDFTNAPLHYMCRGCWNNVKHHASESNLPSRCPSCRVFTAGQTLSQCSYNVMLEIMG